LLQRGKVVAADALLGRFLPRLGPLVATQAASFFALALFAAELLLTDGKTRMPGRYRSRILFSAKRKLPY
jgi:hypothetical protein